MRFNMVLALLSSWLPVFFWAGLIFFLSGVPDLGTGWGIWDFLLRKAAHLAEYAVLALLLVRAFRRTRPAWVPREVLAWGLGLAVFYAVTDEFHQAFVPGRGPSVADVLLDALGAAGACWAFRRKFFPV